MHTAASLSVLLCMAGLGLDGQTKGQPKSQTKPTASCPPVQPRNAQEALMMEGASHKQGCWERNKATGQLVFRSDVSPSRNYKALLGTIRVQWHRDNDCTDVEAFIRNAKGEAVDTVNTGYVDGKWSPTGACVPLESAPLVNSHSESSLPSGSYWVGVAYPGSGTTKYSGRDLPKWETTVTVTAGQTVVVKPPRQHIVITGKPAGGRLGSTPDVYESSGMNFVEFPRCGIGDCRSLPIAPGVYGIEFSGEVPVADGRTEWKSMIRSVTVSAGQTVTIAWPFKMNH
jgi:hypothetical protein